MCSISSCVCICGTNPNHLLAVFVSTAACLLFLCLCASVSGGISFPVCPLLVNVIHHKNLDRNPLDQILDGQTSNSKVTVTSHLSRSGNLSKCGENVQFFFLLGYIMLKKIQKQRWTIVIDSWNPDDWVWLDWLELPHCVRFQLHLSPGYCCLFLVQW